MPVTAGSAVSVRFFPPPAALARHLSLAYYVEVALPDASEGLSDYLLPEWGNLRFVVGTPPHIRSIDGLSSFKTAFVAGGPTTQPVHFTLGTCRFWGVGLLPLGWATFMNEPASTLANVVADGTVHPAFAAFVPLADCLTKSDLSPEEGARLLLGWLEERIVQVRQADRIRAVQEALADPSVLRASDLAEAAGVKLRTLERLCADSFGFSPATMLRRQRVIRSLLAFAANPGVRWSALIDRHYHDQSHFVRDFQAFMGMTPGEYARLPHPIFEQFVHPRAQVWGELTPPPPPSR